MKDNEKAFCTDKLEAEIASKSVSGAIATLSAQLGCFVIRLSSVAVLARLLIPEDFGLIAMALVVTGFASLFKDAGLSMAAVQRKSLTHNQASLLFWINLGLSLLIAILVAAFAPVVAYVFKETRLTSVTVALSSMFLFSGFGLQQLAYLKRHMRLATLGVIEVIAQGMAFLAALCVALYGLSYWALVVQLVLVEVVRTALAWITCPWRPGMPKRDREVVSMITFGFNLTGSNLLGYASSKADVSMIGWMWGSATLGLYSRALNLLQLPRTLILQPINQVAIPALSRLQEDLPRYRQYYRKALLLTLTGTMPIMAFALLAAEPLVLFVLGDQWVESVPIFQALSIAAFCQTLDGAGGWVCTSMGRADRQLRWRLIISPIFIMAVAIGVQWGAIGAAIGLSVAQLVLRLPAIAFLLRDMPVGVRDVIGAAWRPTIASVSALGGVALARSTWTLEDPLVNLIVLGLFFFILYGIILIVLSGGYHGFHRLYSPGRLFKFVKHPRSPSPKSATVDNS